jgi:hypothetical protein
VSSQTHYYTVISHFPFPAGDKIHDHHCELTYQVNVSGYRPEELNAEIQGNQLVLVGDHKEQNQGRPVVFLAFVIFILD